MNKFFIFILCLCCALTVAQATGEDRLNDSDANVFGHVLDKKTGEHLPFINVLLKTRVRDNILKSKEQKNIQPTKGGHKMVTCQNYVSLFYCQITSCPSDGGIS